MERYQREADGGQRYQTQTATQTQSQVSAFISKVYAYMAGALAITAIAAYYTSQSEAVMAAIFGNKILFYGLLIGELGLVVFLSARINKLSYSAAAFTFILYSVLNGLTLSFIFALFTTGSLASTFTATAGTFAVMSVLGFYTKKDLTKLGGILRMALVGLIIATIVNMFWDNSQLYWITTYIGVLIFVGLTAYDTQKIKRIGAQMDIDTDAGKKVAILGALTLYLDFINLFLLLLRFMGDRR
jgi:FtsH-binding integral membrane protein